MTARVLKQIVLSIAVGAVAQAVLAVAAIMTCAVMPYGGQ